MTRLAAAALTCLALGACGRGAGASRPTPRGVIHAVGAENEYANVISQIGGRFVAVTAIMSNPSTDPHTFEASPAVAQSLNNARLIVQNGVGYDPFMTKIESATPSPSRRIIDMQTLLGLPDSTANPHLWYDVKAVQELALRVARALAALQPAHAAYFGSNQGRFDRSLRAVFRAIDGFNERHAGVTAATSEPVANDLLGLMGVKNLTPWTLQADVMNGVDPAPQDLAAENNLLSAHLVKVFVYNQQVTDTVTRAFLGLAASHHVPVVGVYETMPRGYDYQSWILAEVRAIERAVTTGRSTTRL